MEQEKEEEDAEADADGFRADRDLQITDNCHGT